MRYKLFLIIILFSYSLFPNDIYKFVYFNNYPPLSWNQNGITKGIFIDILNEVIYKRMGLIIEHQSYPWERAQLMVKEGKADGYITIPTDERLTYTKTNTVPVFEAEFTIFTNINNENSLKILQIEDFEELGEYKIIHYLGSGWAKERFKNSKIHWTRTLDKTLLLLSLNRADIFIDPSVIVRYNIKKHNFTHSIIGSEKILDRSQFLLCIKKDSSFIKYLDEFDFHLKELNRDGTMEKILSRYR